MADLKIRLDDGSEVGPMDLDMVQTWFQHGLLTRDSLVQPRGSTRWVRLSEAVDLSRFRSAGGTAARNRATARAAIAAPSDVAEDDGARWRLFAASGLFVLLAAAALVVARWPNLVRPELDDVPWLRAGLVLLVLGLALARGWDVGRRAVRIVCLVAVAAAFPAAGIFAARGMRLEALLALTSAALLAVGFVLLLAKGRSALAATASLLVVVLGGAGVVRFARAEAGEEVDVGAWASEDRRIADPAIGLDLPLPGGWVALKPGNPLVPATPTAYATLAQPRVAGFALLLSEPAPKGVLTLEHYLDDVIARRRAAATSIEESWRRDGRLGALASRRAAIVRIAPEDRFAERVVVARDGDRYFALVTWVPEAGAGRALEEVDALEAATSFSGVRSRARTATVQAASLELPQLSTAVIERLVDASASGPAAPGALFRQAMAASARGTGALGPAGARELQALTAASLNALPYNQRVPLADYLRRVAAGQPTAADEDERMHVLAKTATLRLSAAQRERLQRLLDEAIRSSLPER
jgi:hypothetical protein